MGCFVRGGKNGMGCYVRGDKTSMGCYVRGDKNCMGCFVRGGKYLWDVLSGVTKNGMGCFVPGCFVRLPSASSQSLRFILSLRMNSSFITSRTGLKVIKPFHMLNSAELEIPIADKTKMQEI